jgi:hypothetical protein
MEEEKYKSILGAALDENTRWASQDLANLAEVLRDHQRSNQQRKGQVERLHQVLTKERQETAEKKKRNSEGWRKYVTWAKGEIAMRNKRIAVLEAELEAWRVCSFCGCKDCTTFPTTCVKRNMEAQGDA